MSRGDQRERDRAKNLAKQQQRQKAKAAGDPLKRNENDAAALQAKIAAKQAKAASGDGAAADTKMPVPRKKVGTSKKETVDDLLAAGLEAAKKRAK